MPWLKAHENAALVQFDYDILQDEIFNSIRSVLGPEAPALDTFRLQDVDVATAALRLVLGGGRVNIHELFSRDDVVGIFRGFRDGGLEFHADVVLPYRSDFQRIPMHGQHVLVQLETPDEAVLGRITAFSSEGKLSSGSGEEFNIRAVREERRSPRRP